MKRLLTYNYWLMIVAWCLFLNDFNFLANLFGLAACAVLTTKYKRFNYWRLCSVGLIIYLTISLFLERSNITYFFPKLSAFLVTICINCSLTNECLNLLKVKYLVPFLAVMVVSMSVLSIITIVLPNSSYSLFTKKSLYLMEAIIFLPYLIPCACDYAYKLVKSHKTITILQSKGTTM